MRQVFEKAVNAVAQRKSRQVEDRSCSTDKRQEPKAPVTEFDMSPEDALRVGTVAGYK